jgi:hypothetical protein
MWQNKRSRTHHQQVPKGEGACGGGVLKGYIAITDEEILEEFFQNGKFIGQIVRERKVGIARIRKVIRDKGAN